VNVHDRIIARRLGTIVAMRDTVLALDQANALLGGLTPQQFMRRHWQKKPLLVRQALPGLKAPVTRAELFALAARDDVQSRLVLRDARRWSLHHGPLARRSLPPLSQPRWTLLVQGVDLHVAAAHALLSQFRFVPQARLDDLMVSWASDGGGVGPHFDSYDVFLIQVRGRRRWRVAPLRDAALRPGLPLKILARFEPEQEWVLEPGDLLYLPPRWAHDGIAVGECMTCSVGFRAPRAGELAREVLERLVDAAGDAAESPLYRDPQQRATAAPGEVPSALAAFAHKALHELLAAPGAIECALGETLSEPKPQVWFTPVPPQRLGARQGVRLDVRSSMLYDSQHVFLNGESWRAAGADARVLRRLADARQLDAAALARASPAVRETVAQWMAQGWAHAIDPGDDE
jgi:50S ribosomal protein L16 3-hydroxylase